MRPEKFFALLVFFVFSLSGIAAAASGNVAELRIDEIAAPIKAGSMLDFSFTAGNRFGPACAAEMEYWFDKGGEIQGSDTFYLEEGQVISREASLILAASASGIKQFFLQMKCNDANIIASRKIEITQEIPVLPLFSNFAVSESGEGKQAGFSYVLQSNSGETVSIAVRERILKGDEIVWENSQNVPVAQGIEIERLGPVLPVGNYTLVVDAVAGKEKATVTMEFAVKTAVAAPAGFPWVQAIAVAGIALLLFASVFVLSRLFSKAPILPPLPAVPGILKPKEKPVAGEERTKLFESEQFGRPNELELSRVLELVGKKGEERAKAADFALRTEVKQAVKSFIVMDKEKRARFETSVSVSLANYTNRNWDNVVILARLPLFLGEEIIETIGDTRLNAERAGSVLKVTLEKVGAMQSASYSYAVPKMVSQAEANSIPLPAVISYEESEPLVITQVKVEKPKKAKAKPVLKAKARNPLRQKL